MQSIFAQYMEEKGSEPTDLRTVGAWALKNKKWAPRPADILDRFQEQMSHALREEYRVDAKGRRYRSKHAVRQTKGGKQLSLWADIDEAPRSHMVKAFGQRRKQIVGDCFQLHQDVEHYNDVNPSKEPIQLVLDFTDDVEERMIDTGIGNADAA